MKTCPSCHKESPDNAAVCPFCGTPTGAAQPSFQGAAAPPQQHPQGAPPQAPCGAPCQQAPYGCGASRPPCGHTQGACPPQGAYPQQLGEVSPKKRNTVILLNFFLGIVGAHRFYLGKAITGILMALTLGGLFIWSFVDLFISTFGNYKDSKGRFVDKRCSKAMAAFFPVLQGLFSICIVLHVSGVAAGEQAEKQSDKEYWVQNACHQVMIMEDIYYQNRNEYTTDYGELQRKVGLQMVPDYDYGPIQIVANSGTGKQGVRFVLRHKQDPEIACEVDTSVDETVRKVSR